jgi:hypothetical protein
MIITSSQTTPRCKGGVRWPKQENDRRGENTSTDLRIIDIMNLVKNHKLNVSDEVSALVKHASENLGRHDQAARLRVDLDVSG